MSDYFLSRVQLNSLSIINDFNKFNSTYKQHQILWLLFSEDSKARFLYRTEITKEQLNISSNKPIYYVLSHEYPKQDHPYFKVETKLFNPKIHKGQQLTFKLRVNPVVTRCLPEKSKSTRHDVIMDAKYQHIINNCIEKGIITKDNSKKNTYQIKQLINMLKNNGKLTDHKQFIVDQQECINNACLQWFKKRSEKHGFSFDNKNIEYFGNIWHSLYQAKKHKKAGFNSIDYNGKLEVTNPELFFDMLVNGLGPAKGFGCGLMLIRKI